jgi:hypothetical protein
MYPNRATIKTFININLPTHFIIHYMAGHLIESQIEVPKNNYIIKSDLYQGKLPVKSYMS